VETVPEPVSVWEDPMSGIPGASENFPPISPFKETWCGFTTPTTAAPPALSAIRRSKNSACGRRFRDAIRRAPSARTNLVEIPPSPITRSAARHTAEDQMPRR
jgi:hypothetical protein